MLLGIHLIGCPLLAGEGQNVSELGTKHKFHLHPVLPRAGCINAGNHQGAIKARTIFGIVTLVQISLPLPGHFGLARSRPVPEAPYE